jgi:hypothetical protein
MINIIISLIFFLYRIPERIMNLAGRNETCKISYLGGYNNQFFYQNSIIRITSVIYAKMCVNKFRKFSTNIVLNKDRLALDAIARLSAWSFESPNILLARNKTITREIVQCFMDPVLKIVKHFIKRLSFYYICSESSTEQFMRKS